MSDIGCWIWVSSDMACPDVRARPSAARSLAWCARRMETGSAATGISGGNRAGPSSALSHWFSILSTCSTAAAGGPVPCRRGPGRRRAASRGCGRCRAGTRRSGARGWPRAGPVRRVPPSARSARFAGGSPPIVNGSRPVEGLSSAPTARPRSCRRSRASSGRRPMPKVRRSVS